MPRFELPVRVERRRAPPADERRPPLHPATWLDQALAARGIRSPDELDVRLAGLPAAERLLGATAAARLLADALAGGQPIMVVGDFDADGATAAALMVGVLRAFLDARQLDPEQRPPLAESLTRPPPVDYLVPDRFVHGYGLSVPLVEVAIARGARLIVTVDNGIAAVEAIKHAQASGVPVIVTDHHLPGEELPPAAVIVNPNQAACSFESKAMAGVGVAFYVMLAARAELRRRGWFADDTGPNLAEWLDLVALGTVADVVPLDRVNRILVAQGLRRIRAGRARPGLVALAQVARRDLDFLSAEDLAFALAPRLNAAGRLADMGIGIRCLLAPALTAALPVAKELQAINAARREIEATMTDQAARAADLVMIAHEDGAPPAGLVLHDAGWHEGVIGIVAGRVRERTQRPVFAFARTQDGWLKGSGRSVAALHLRDALHNMATRQPALLERFGGHAMAAGVTLAPGRLAAFRAAFVAEARRWLGNLPLEQCFETDGSLPLSELTVRGARALERAGPWGQAFPEPTFDDDFGLVAIRPITAQVTRLALSRAGRVFDAVCFAGPPALAVGSTVRVVYRLGINRFRQRETLELRVTHMAPT